FAIIHPRGVERHRGALQAGIAARFSPAVRLLTPTRRFFVEPEVRAIVVVVSHVLGEHPTEMALVQDDDVVEQLAAHAADPALGYAVLPGAAVRRPLRRDTE